MVHKHNWNIYMKAKFSKSIGKRRLALRRKTTSSSLERDTDPGTQTGKFMFAPIFQLKYICEIKTLTSLLHFYMA